MGILPPNRNGTMRKYRYGSAVLYVFMFFQVLASALKNDQPSSSRQVFLIAGVVSFLMLAIQQLIPETWSKAKRIIDRMVIVITIIVVGLGIWQFIV